MRNCGVSAFGNRLLPMIGTSAADSSSEPPMAATTVAFGRARRVVQRRAVVAMDQRPSPAAAARLPCGSSFSFSTRLARKGMMNSAMSSEPTIADDDGHRQHADELARPARQRHQRQEGEDQRGRAAEDRDEDLPRAGERRLEARAALRADAARCSRPRRSNRPPASPAPRRIPQSRSGSASSPGSRAPSAPNASDSGIETITMPAARQPSGSSVSEHERDGDAEVLVEPREPLAARCATGRSPRSSVMRFGRPLSKRAMAAFSCVAHLEDVVAILLVRRDDHRALAVEARDVAPRLRIPSSRVRGRARARSGPPPRRPRCRALHRARCTRRRSSG